MKGDGKRAKEPRPFPSFEEFKGWVQNQDFGSSKPSIEWEKKAYPAIYSYFRERCLEILECVYERIERMEAILKG
ncbi:MAG: hypothetical protein QXG08_06345 [Candidatus Methanomethyliaceae archaeon]